ncbi:hypothetical protein ASE86_03045 [Sphingomonas sp. Leaf33]|nr:hypothetical protein ASE86_03045 [Sphingomonas sp. Leaf33]
MRAAVLNFETQSQVSRHNRLLGTLTGDDLGRLRPHLRRVDLAAGQCVSLLSNGHAVACFPLSLVASIVQVLDDGTRFDVGLVGSEGVLGWPSVLSFVPEPQSALVQLGGGSALAIPAEALIAACEASPSLHVAMLRFVDSFTVQMSHTIIANLRDGIEQRLARWLLMLHDRIDGDKMAITHGELASALHVRRASITDALHVLEGERMLRCTRGQITVRDRAGLTAVAGSSYGPAETRYRTLVGDFGKV